jgi:hypothetical protein
MRKELELLNKDIENSNNIIKKMERIFTIKK